MRPIHPAVRVAAIMLGAIAIWGGTSLAARLLFGEEYMIAAHVFRAIVTAILVGLLLLALLWWQRVDAAYYGLLPSPRAARLAGVGALGFAVPCAIAAAAVIALGLARLEVADPVLLIGQALAVLALVLLYEAIPEELIFRGYIFTALREKLPVWATILLQAALFCAFGVVIGAAAEPERLLLFAVFSVALGVIRAVTGSVFATIGFHAAFQLITQTINGDQWRSIALVDPELWFRDLAFFLAPLVLGPLLVWQIARRPRPLVAERT